MISYVVLKVVNCVPTLWANDEHILGQTLVAGRMKDEEWSLEGLSYLNALCETYVGAQRSLTGVTDIDELLTCLL